MFSLDIVKTQLSKRSKMRWFTKHLEHSHKKNQWILTEVFDSSDWERICSIESLKYLENSYKAEFVKRYLTEEELNIHFALEFSGSAKLKNLH